jgi:hypothetical protein
MGGCNFTRGNYQSLTDLRKMFFSRRSIPPTAMFASFRISLLRPRRAPAEAHSRRVTDLKHGSSCSRNNVKIVVESS